MKDNWIKVEDKLPDQVGRYLVCNKYGVSITEYLVSEGIIPRKHWYNHEPTHWQPLPESPKE